MRLNTSRAQKLYGEILHECQYFLPDPSFCFLLRSSGWPFALREIGMLYRLTALLVIVASFVMVNACKNLGPNANDQKLKEVEHLVTGIPVYSGMIEISSHTISKVHAATVSKYYKSSASYNDVKGFYIEQMQRLGWQLKDEDNVKDWQKDLGGRELVFRNGEFSFAIQYAGEKSGYTWEYATTLGWSE
jgi:hypothetical protein